MASSPSPDKASVSAAVALDYQKLEIEWKNELKAGRRVSVNVRALYEGSSKRPDIILVTYYMSGKILERSFPNEKGGK